MNSTTIATGGRAARSKVYDSLAWAYQDSGLLGALMCGTLDAPETIPAGAVRADRSGRIAQHSAILTAPREQHNFREG